MITVQVVGPYLQNSVSVVETDESYELDLAHRIVVVIAVGVTLTLPPNPNQGETHLVLATGGDVNIAGGANPIQGGAGDLVVPEDTSMEVTWSGTAQGWIPLSNGSAGPSPVFLTQAAWFIDPQNVSGFASDANNGATAITPLLTYQEAYERVFGQGPGAVLRQNTTVTWLSAPTGLADPINVNVGVAGGFTLTFQAAAPTTRITGTFTGVTGINPATNQAQQVVDTGLPLANSWSAQVNHRIRVTNGPRLGIYGWVARDLNPANPKTARTSRFTTKSADPINTPIVPSAPQIGDSYQVETLMPIQLGSIQISSPTVNLLGFPPTVVFNDFDFSAGLAPGTTNVCTPQFSGVGAAVSFQGCNTVFAEFGSWGSGRAEYDNCFLSTYANVVGPSLFLAGLTNPAFGVVMARAAQFNFDHLIQGGGGLQVENGGYAIIQSLAIFDSSEDGIVFFNGSGGSVSGVLYGSGNSQTGMAVLGSSDVSLQVGTPATDITITGTAGDFRLQGGANNARAFDETAGAYTAVRAQTWALFQTAVAGGGFGGNAHNLTENNHIVSMS
jgi:hypothetical protein